MVPPSDSTPWFRQSCEKADQSSAFRGVCKHRAKYQVPCVILLTCVYTHIWRPDTLFICVRVFDDDGLHNVRTRGCSKVHPLLAAHLEIWSTCGVFEAHLNFKSTTLILDENVLNPLCGKKERKRGKKTPAPRPLNFFLFFASSSPLSSLALIALPSSLCSTFPVHTYPPPPL